MICFSNEIYYYFIETFYTNYIKDIIFNNLNVWLSHVFKFSLPCIIFSCTKTVIKGTLKNVIFAIINLFKQECN